MPTSTKPQIEEVTSKVKIEDLIGQSFTLIGSGNILTTREHESLKIFVDRQKWHWYSKDTGGDIFDWYQFIHQVDFETAVNALARMAGVERKQQANSLKLSQAEKLGSLTIPAAHYQCLEAAIENLRQLALKLLDSDLSLMQTHHVHEMRRHRLDILALFTSDTPTDEGFVYNEAEAVDPYQTATPSEV